MKKKTIITCKEIVTLGLDGAGQNTYEGIIFSIWVQNEALSQTSVFLL